MSLKFGRIQPWTVELAALDQFEKNLLLENYSKYFDDLLSGERSLPFGLLVSICYHGNQRLDLAEFHSSKLSCVLSLPASMKRSNQEKLRKSGDIVFPIISLWGFFRRSRAANSPVDSPIRPKFKLVRALMHVCKYEKDRMKNS